MFSSPCFSKLFFSFLLFFLFFFFFLFLKDRELGFRIQLFSSFRVCQKNHKSPGQGGGGEEDGALHVLLPLEFRCTLLQQSHLLIGTDVAEMCTLRVRRHCAIEANAINNCGCLSEKTGQPTPTPKSDQAADQQPRHC